MIRRFTLSVAIWAFLTARCPWPVEATQLYLLQTAETQPNAQETVLSRKDADFVFSRTKLQWDRDVNNFFAPGRVVRATKHDTGTAVTAVDPITGIAILVQPFYRNDYEPPELVVIANFFPIGVLPPMTEDLRKDMEAAAQKDLAPTYSVRVRYGSTEEKTPPTSALSNPWTKCCRNS